MHHISQKVAISSVSVGSAFRVGVVMGIVGGVLLMIISVALALLGLGASGYSYGYSSYSVSINFAALCPTFLITTIISAIGGGIGAAIYAWIYNIAAGWIGGLEITLEGTSYSHDVSPTKPPVISSSPAPATGSSAKICPDCGHKNMSFRSTCENCGAALK